MEKIISDIKKTAVSAAQKTGEFVEIGKLKLLCAKLNNKIDEQYKELGKALYNAEKDESGNADEIQSIMSKIDLMFEELAVHEGELAQFKNQKKCPACGFFCSDESVFCSKCGEKF